MDNSELTEQARLGWPADRVAKVLAIALGLPWPVVGWQCKECQFKSQCVVNREVVSGSEERGGRNTTLWRERSMPGGEVSVSLSDADAAALAAHALTYVRPGQVIGLGSGRAATAFVHALGREAQAGLRVTGVPTSEATAALARQLGIPLASLEDSPSIDVTLDGADEVDACLDLIKGYGGALIREKVVAAAARRLVILVGGDKVVPVLGSRGKLPIEVVPVRGWVLSAATGRGRLRPCAAARTDPRQS